MCDKYNQPFYLPPNRRPAWMVRKGLAYLPPLEPPEPLDEAQAKDSEPAAATPSERLAQVEGKLNYLQTKIQAHLTPKKWLFKQASKVKDISV